MSSSRLFGGRKDGRVFETTFSSALGPLDLDLWCTKAGAFRDVGAKEAEAEAGLGAFIVCSISSREAGALWLGGVDGGGVCEAADSGPVEAGDAVVTAS